ncbi:DUF1116 domain-containing protein, partial [Salmonella enterica subsp. enterica serovar Virginia]|nr:DUF1116 domain-containing protein [Salmonella enterica subsp. enterica serovar Virginia]
FGIRVSGLGDRWFTAPVNTPQGLFFTGFSQDQANPDMGDSAIILRRELMRQRGYFAYAASHYQTHQ